MKQVVQAKEPNYQECLNRGTAKQRQPIRSIVRCHEENHCPFKLDTGTPGNVFCSMALKEDGKKNGKKEKENWGQGFVLDLSRL